MQTKTHTTVLNLSQIEDTIDSLNKTILYLMGKLSKNSAELYVTTWYNYIYNTPVDLPNLILNYIAIETIKNKRLLFQAITDFEYIEDYLKSHLNSSNRGKDTPTSKVGEELPLADRQLLSFVV